MEHFSMLDDGSSAASPRSSYSYTSPPSSTHLWQSPLAYSSSECTSSPAISDDALIEYPLAKLDQDWEILSELFINDALDSLPPSFNVNLSPNSKFTTSNSTKFPQFKQSEATPTSPFVGALPVNFSNSNTSQHSLEQVQLAPQSTGTSSQKTQKLKKIMRPRGRKVVTSDLQKESLSLEEQKKQKRRLQIASGVQRHREKKRCLMSSLQTEMTRLTTHLAALRAARRAQLADNDQLVAYEEEAMMQRRKRKQVEQTNQMLKQALFQQTAFLGGMKVLMGGGNLPCSRTLEFHDWVHSYTALASRDTLARRKEYVAHFPQSKMDLANKLVLKNTEEDIQRLVATGQVCSGNIRILHDGTRDAQELDDGYTDVVMQGLFGRSNSNTPYGSTTDNAGDGCVIKEFSSVFLFRETAHCTVNTLMDQVFASMKSIGVYYPGSTYQSCSVDEVDQDEDDEVTKSRVYYSDLAASVQPILEVVDDSQNTEDIKVEARTLTREQRGRDEGMILWDYVDEDSLHPMPVDSPGSRTIRRNVCGGMVIRRELGTGMLSVRHVSIKGYCPLSKSKDVASAVETPDAEEARRVVSRRIGLQATEHDRMKDRCMRYVFNDITNRMNALHVS